MTEHAQDSFSTLPLRPPLLQSLESLGFDSMTPIQAESLPLVLAGTDVIGQGKTGSGKTAAFALGVLNKLDVKRFQIQSLILCPTRELADQVAKEIRRLARNIHNIKVLTLCGGMPFGPQINSLEHGAHIVVGTPGRIEEHVRKQHLQLGKVTTLVLDEADRMLQMGFQQALDAIIGQVPQQRQSLLFSATYPEAIEAMATRYMREPVFLKVASTHNATSIKQVFYSVKNDDRSGAVKTLLLHAQAASAVIFCNTKREVKELAELLNGAGYCAAALHGDLEQRDRDQALVRFANGSVNVLVATDVAARGLDVDDLELVVNYQIPRDPEVYVHRIGRTGRAGAKGRSFTLCSDKELHKLAALETLQDDRFVLEQLPKAPAKVPAEQAPKMVTLQIDGGKKQKVRPGDIVGCLTGEDGVTQNDIGKINVFDFSAYVAVDRSVFRQALKKIQTGTLKGRRFRVRLLD
ncbi:ATP-dependent RNA helicase DbpA [Gilvimarinus agarilyticus]|uniref:ATP-dependent RNA helicase DbpA n=1 Tax=Gilvimarinus sp. 2_MG-2023 TaxID=3062666 RepID=UPI001C084252|nr:ATP-dependent RNA helicase DbpA [Gilvimarinus sp. 2_MG-2023]MBU2884656.1 ATP-dependent RNA helicase DbpA [Gilvimarinus agarilyticus]MDO6569763.1 ATP-dependent RNA helicase DbpA [Gilvimarinus sp. 2_MG-2023]